MAGKVELKKKEFDYILKENRREMTTENQRTKISTQSSCFSLFLRILSYGSFFFFFFIDFFFFHFIFFFLFFLFFRFLWFFFFFFFFFVAIFIFSIIAGLQCSLNFLLYSTVTQSHIQYTFFFPHSILSTISD